MGLPSPLSPCDGGVLCLILVSTAISFSIIKGVVYYILRVLGIRRSDPDDDDIFSYTCFHYYPSFDSEESYRFDSSNDFLDEFRSGTRAVRFESVRGVLEEEEQLECVVCLSRFEPESEIHLLFCEHMFHKECLDKWLGYWNLTCPLCRMPLILHHHDHDYDYDYVDYNQN